MLEEGSARPQGGRASEAASAGLDSRQEANWDRTGITSQTALEVPRTMGSYAAVEALLALKSKKGWTMEELAGEVGTTARTLQGFKKRHTVRSSVFRTMANRLKVSPEDLLAGNIPGVR